MSTPAERAAAADAKESAAGPQDMDLAPTEAPAGEVVAAGAPPPTTVDDTDEGREAGRAAARALLRKHMPQLLEDADEDGPIEPAEAKPAEKPAEAAKPKADVAEEETPRQSAAIERLARKEGELLEREAALTREREKFSKIDALLASDDPLDMLEGLGRLTGKDLSYRTLTQKIAKKPAPEVTEAKSVADELKALRDEIKQERAAIQEERNAAKVRGLISDAAKKDTERYEEVLAGGEEAVAEVYSVMENHLRRTGKVMPMADALDAIESLRLGDKAMKARKSKGAAPAATETKNGQTPPSKTGPGTASGDGPRTLTQELPASAIRSKNEQDDGTHDAEYYRRQGLKVLRGAATQ